MTLCLYFVFMVCVVFVFFLFSGGPKSKNIPFRSPYFGGIPKDDSVETDRWVARKPSSGCGGHRVVLVPAFHGGHRKAGKGVLSKWVKCLVVLIFPVQKLWLPQDFRGDFPFFFYE